MGLDYSKLLVGSPKEPPKTVLVPPLFERDLKGRSRMAKSSFDYQFAKPALRWLFEDYYGQGLNSVLFFAPSADPRISVKAKIGSEDAGTLSLRFQPLGLREPLCFADIKASPRSAGDVTLRLCGFSTEGGLGAFATLPMAKHVSGKRAQVGVRYSSPDLSSGAIIQPATNTLEALWLVGRRDGVTAGLQLRPCLALHDVSGALRSATAAAGGAPEWLRAVSSVAVAYSPAAGGRTRGGQPAFTAAMEMQEGRSFIMSFFQHMAAVRQVFNPLESDSVIGITNYIDVGMQLQVPLATSDEGGGDTTGLRIAASWQANKNVLLKGRLGSDGVALLAAFKSWFQPSLALAVSCEYNFRASQPRFGFTAQVENFGALRYERSREVQVHGRTLTQRHEATNAEVAMSQHDRPLVDLGAADATFNAAEPASVEYL
ncbi:hypothetical protein MNEG_9348 [Monoraphidium neglectum]|uniref:Uncharacterized protein n=1 Tax=Monoraphidium neglectum TaxID=145388 RepID=A0A0D2M566_9CHLO|nr:hypothetical protein MNEG_9348 [Monoraphidium neglectum]KIY98614.1 hypothetical protein MNEG_9348 [Monoraphidium neglectum]|eukprot:XP_013897634.1 hypothetical protein MNEG_9348 [Monoraphidium neglectum]